MKARAWLLLEMEEVRSGSMATRTVKVVGVRQTQPLDRLAIHVAIEIPEEVIMPKAKLLVDHQEAIKLELSDA
jgi:hypothetical protein